MLRARAFPVLLFPVLLSIGIVLIPLVPSFADHELVLKGVEQGTRWFAGHIVAAAAFGVGAWAVFEIANELQRRTSRGNTLLLSLTTMGASIYAAGLGADGIAPIALKTAGVSPLAFFEGGFWVSGVFMLATLLFGVGLISTAIRAIRAGLVEGIWRYVVFVSALIFVAAPAVPSGFALYGEGIACLGVFVPIGAMMARSK